MAEPGGAVQAELADHLRALVVRAVGVREGRWRFHPGDEFAADGPLVELLPLQVILEGARLGIPVGHLAAALKAVTGAYPVRTAEFQQLLPAAGLGTADLRLALSLDGRITTRAWLEGRASDLKDALSLLWFLSMVGAVAFREEPGEGGRLPGAARRPAGRAPPPERGDAIRQAALRVLPGTYLHALGVERDADDEAVEQAYRAVAARFHPDGYAEYDVGDLSDLLATIQDRLAAAYRVLGNAERRRAYLEYLLVRLEQTGARRPGVDSGTPSAASSAASGRSSFAATRRRSPRSARRSAGTPASPSTRPCSPSRSSSTPASRPPRAPRTATTILLSTIDIARLASRKVSPGQATKNITTNAMGAVGGTGGWLAGAAGGAYLGTVILPGIWYADM